MLKLKYYTQNTGWFEQLKYHLGQTWTNDNIVSLYPESMSIYSHSLSIYSNPAFPEKYESLYVAKRLDTQLPFLVGFNINIIMCISRRLVWCKIFCLAPQSLVVFLSFESHSWSWEFIVAKLAKQKCGFPFFWKSFSVFIFILFHVSLFVKFIVQTIWLISVIFIYHPL